MGGNKKSATINDSGLGAVARPLHCKVYKQTYWAGLKFDNKKAMTGNARHGEWLAEMERLNIPLHTTFYCFIKLLVNHAFTSFKPFHLFRISQAYIYNSALSCIIRVRKISRLRSLQWRLNYYLIYFLRSQRIFCTVTFMFLHPNI